MAELHPDKHHGKAMPDQDALRQQASQVTQSYQILKQAPSRATHLLHLLGRVENESLEEASLRELLGGTSSSSTQTNLLLQVMEIREVIEEASNDDDLKPLLEENNQRMDDICDQLGNAFDAQDLDRALELTVMLQYFHRIDETIREKMEH